MNKISAISFFVCLTILAWLVAIKDPWDIADSQAVKDSRAFEQLANQPASIGILLGQRASISYVLVWDEKDELVYPPSKGFTPVQYEISRERMREIESQRETSAAPFWTSLDQNGTQLLACRHADKICLIYDRLQLEQKLELRAATLSEVNAADRKTVLAGLAGLLLVLGWVPIWRARSKQDTQVQFELLPDKFLARRGDLTIDLTPRDVAILSILLQREGAVVTKDDLYDAGWGRDFMPNSRALDQHIINLRQKLDPDKTRPALIHTVRGVGYRLEA